MLEERGHPGGGDEHSAVGALGLPGVNAGALLGQPLQPLLSVCSVRGWQVRPPEDLDIFFLTEVVMIHFRMEVLGLDEEEGEDAARRGDGRETL